MIHSSSDTSIITGAARGIGLEISKNLYEIGCNIVLNDADELALNEACNVFFPSKERCIPVAGNVGDIKVNKHLVETAMKHFGSINCVVANAGITSFANFLDCTESQFDGMMAINLKGTFFLVQEAVKAMTTFEGNKSILIMSSVTGIQAHGQLTAYGMSKAALAMMAKNLVVELSPLGIRINALAPGATITERTNTKEFHDEWEKITPLGRPASVSDIADAALFLLSDKARHITGQTLIVDGGWTSISPQP